MTEDSPRIVKRTEPLSEEFLPETFPGRREQVGELRNCLPGAQVGQPAHVWVHGPPGSGKSSLVRSVVSQLEEQSVRTALVNCWSSKTFFSVLEAVLLELRALVGDQRDVAFKFDRLQRLARERSLVIVLDEVDQMFLKERDAALYNLSRLDHAGLVCLSQTREAHLELDPRVRSRLQPRFLEFTPYSREELVAILEARASQSLVPESWCQADLEWIAGKSGGDARIAIQSLRTAVYLAEKGRIPQVRVKDIEEGLRRSDDLRKRYQLKALSEHHRLLFQIVKDAKRISTVEAWRKYLHLAKEQGLKPMKRRTFNHYKQYLVQNRLLQERQARGRNNRRILEVME